MGSVKALDGHAYCLCFLNRSRFSVILILAYCLWEASLHACTAIDTFEGIICPSAVFQTDFYSFGGTHSGTITT